MTYIVAVSGGIDSVALLDMIYRSEITVGEGASTIIVAHVDHGIRTDSRDDEAFVRDLAAHYGYHYESIRYELGQYASEEDARTVRYRWLHKIAQDYNAAAIVTAHHQDDVIETMFINIIRGTGWKGLISLRSKPGMLRPLIDFSKASLAAHALQHDLSWREDNTNNQARYLRNYVRQMYMNRLSPAQRRQMYQIYERTCELAREIDREVMSVLPMARSKHGLSRYWLGNVDDSVFREVIMYELGGRLPQMSLQRLRHFIATARSGKLLIECGITFEVTDQELIVSRPSI